MSGCKGATLGRFYSLLNEVGDEICCGNMPTCALTYAETWKGNICAIALTFYLIEILVTCVDMYSLMGDFTSLVPHPHQRPSDPEKQ